MFLKAQPIWLKNKREAKNFQAGFRYDFKADESKKYTLKITASSLYRVFLNGEFAGYGPARAGHGYIRFDEITLGIKRGINKIAIEVAGYNCACFYTRAIKSFLCAEVLENNNVVGYTGKDFKAISLEHLRSMYVSRYSFQRAYSEVWNLNNEDNLTNWITADKLQTEKVISFDLSEKFIPRNLPLPNYDVVKAVNIEESGIIKHKEFTGELPRYISEISADRSDGYLLSDITERPFWELYGEFIPGEISNKWERSQINSDEYVIFKMPCNKSGFLKNNITALEDSSVYVFFSEYNYGNGMIFDALRCQMNIVKYNLKKSNKPYELESFEAYTCQYIGIAVKKGKIIADNPRMREYCYPTSDNAEFVSDDSELNGIFNAAAETFKQNTLDVYMDCPGRERGGWLCDSYFTAQSEIFFTGKSDVENVFLDNFVIADEFPNVPCGMLPHNYPADIRMYNDGYIPQWAMWYVIELGEYVKVRAIADTEKYRNICYDLLEWFKKYENNDGLLERIPGWNFIEWSKANEWINDVNYPTNMLYSKMLSIMGEIFDDKALWKKAEAIKENIIVQSFDGEYFADNAIREEDGTLKCTENRSETCQYYAYFTGTADVKNKQFEKLTDTILNVFGPERKQKGDMPEIAFANAFIGNYLRLIILLREKQFDKVIADIKGYFTNMYRLTGTLWENDELDKAKHGGSLNHGFASFAGVALAFAISGISEINYKQKTIVIDKKYKAKINYNFSYNTRDGRINIKEKDGSKFVEIPENWLAL